MATHALSRRQLIWNLSTGLAAATMSPRALLTARRSTIASSAQAPYPDDLLSSGIRSRFVDNVNGLRMHLLEAGYDTTSRAAVLLLHGFPELAYSWRNVMPRLANAGYHVIAPDLRGYGRTDGAGVTFDDDLRPFRMLNEIQDMLALVSALGYQHLHLVGHDFGSLVASWCAVARPDIFRSVVLMSAPFAGTATLPFDTADTPSSSAHIEPGVDIAVGLARLTPPRKHYRNFYASRQANDNMWRAEQGIHDFLRAYYHMKSGDWANNQPYPLAEWSASELAKLPHYYVMELDKGMAETVAPHMPSTNEIDRCEWLPDADLQVYSAEYSRTGFQGGLQWYRSNSSVASIFGETGINADLRVFAGRTIDQPSLFIAGKRDWGIYQRPGSLETMETKACTDMRGMHLLEGAGHWVQQERPAASSRLIQDFLSRL